MRQKYKRNSTPKYQKIYEDIKSKILNNDFKVGDQLPTEKDFIVKYDVSRITTKRAMDLLVNEDFIERIPGKGTFVINREVIENENLNINLPKQKHLLLGYVVSGIDDNHGLELLTEIERSASELSINIIVKQTHNDVDKEKEAIKLLLKQGVEGLIIFPVTEKYYNEDIVKLNLDQFPHILVDRYLKGFTTTTVSSDNKDLSIIGVQHLFDHHHEHIALLTPPYKNNSALEDRVKGFINAFEQRGLLVNRKLWIEGILSSLPQFQDELVKKDIQVIKDLLIAQPNITAIFATQYSTALLAKEAILSLNKRIPEDISIICYDAPLNSIGSVVFTHLKQDTHKMAEELITGIVRLINGEKQALRTVIKGKLIDQKSVLSIK